MDQATLEVELKTLLSPVVWKSASELLQELGARLRIKKKSGPRSLRSIPRLEPSVDLEQVYGTLSKLEKERLVMSRKRPHTSTPEWRLTGNTSGLPVEEIPVNPKELTGGARVPLPA